MIVSPSHNTRLRAAAPLSLLCGCLFLLAGCGSSTPVGSGPVQGTGSSTSPFTPGTSASVVLGTTTVHDLASPEPAAISSDASGNATLVWTDPSGQVYASRLPAGSTTWGTPTPLLPSGSGYTAIRGITFAFSNALGTTALFMANSPTTSVLLATSLLTGTSQWTAPVAIPISSFAMPTATMQTDGTIDVAYTSNGSTINTVTFFPPAQFWGTPTTLWSIASGSSLEQLAITSSLEKGAVTVLWAATITPNPYPNEPPSSGIYAGTVPNSVIPLAAPIEVEAVDGVVASYPNVISDAQGNLTALWITSPPGGSNHDIYSSRRIAGTYTWTTPVQLDNTSNSNFPYVGYPTPMVVDAQGNVTIAWVTAYSVPQTVQAVRFNASTAQWSDATLVRTLPYGSIAGSPALTVDPASGQVSVLWNEQPQSTSESVVGDIFQSIYSPTSGTWGEAIEADLPFSASRSAAATFPVAASTGSSSVAVAWGDLDPSANNDYTFKLFANSLQ